MASTVTVDFTANLARFTSSLDKATSDLSKFQRNSDRIAGQIKGAFGALGLGLGVAGIAAFGKSVIDAADNLNDMSVRTGVAVKDLASLKTAAEQNGTTIDGVATALQKLTLSFGQAQGGSDEAADALKRLGVTSGDSRERLYQLADAYVKSGGDARTLADIQKVLGRGYAEVLPLLAHGADGLRKSAEASESFADAMARLAPNADAFNDQLAALKNNTSGLAASFLADFVPALNEATGAISLAYREGGLLHAMWIALGGAAAMALGETQVQQTKARLKELESIISASEARLKSGTLDPEGKSIFIPNIKLNEKALQQLREQTEKFKAERTAILKSMEAPPKPVAQVLPGLPTKTPRAAADPLASLLGQTDIGRLAEFDKQVALLNQRFDFGRKNVELYNQAMTLLVEKTFSANFKQSEDEARAAAKAAQDYASAIATLVADTDIAKAEKLYQNIDLLNKAFFDGIDGVKLSVEQYDQAMTQLLERTDKLKPAVDEMSEYAKKAAQNIQSAFADFLFNPFDKGLKGMLQSFLQTMARIAANRAAAQILAGLGTWGTTGGGAGTFLGSVASTLFSPTKNALGGVYSSPGLSSYSGSVVSRPTLFPFAKGVGLMGEAGPEAILPLKRGPGGRLGVEAGGGAGMSVVVNVDASGSSAQGEGQGAELGRMIGSAVRGVLMQEMRPGGMLA